MADDITRKQQYDFITGATQGATAGAGLGFAVG